MYNIIIPTPAEIQQKLDAEPLASSILQLCVKKIREIKNLKEEITLEIDEEILDSPHFRKAMNMARDQLNRYDWNLMYYPGDRTTLHLNPIERAMPSAKKKRT